MDVYIKRILIFIPVLLASVILIPVHPDSTDYTKLLTQIDKLLKEDQNDKALELIGDAVYSDRPAYENGALLWRRSRAYFSKTDLDHYRGRIKKSKAIENLSVAEDYADQAIEYLRAYKQENTSRDVLLENDLARAYFWKSANIGKIGQLKGVLSSLMKADDIRDLLKNAIEFDPEYSNSYYILGQLYEQLPGAPISFGDDYAAVSFGRAAVDLHEQDMNDGRISQTYFDYYTELARHLWERNWDSDERLEAQQDNMSVFHNENSLFEKMKYYEASIQIDSISDREEAKALITWVINKMRSEKDQGTRLKRDLSKAEEIASDWNVTLP